MAGNKKPTKTELGPISKDDQRKHYTEQLEIAKKSLAEKTKRGDEKGMEHAQGIIDNILGTLSRL